MFRDIAELLLDSILLLLHSNEPDVKVMISKFIELIQNDKNAHLFSDPELITCLSTLTLDLLRQDDTTSKSEQAEVLIKFATNKTLKKNTQIQDALKTIFSNPDGMSEAKIKRLYQKIKNNIAYHSCNNSIKKMYGQLSKVATSDDEDNQGMVLSDIVNTAKDMIEAEARGLSNIDKSVVERIDMSDPKSILPSIQKFNTSEVINVLKTPLQGFNMMCGRRGGIALGESVSINALPGMYKSGLLKLLAYGITRLNTPSIALGDGIPLILFISLENEANKDMMWWYRQMYAEQFGKYPQGLSDDDIAKYVADNFGSCGYKLLVERRLGATFGFDEYCMLIEEYRAMGYRPACVLIDYMNLMKKLTKVSGGKARADHLMLADLYNNTCNFNKTSSITQISAHQLNRQASELAHSGKQNIVKMFGENVMADGMGVQREIDLSVFIHLEYDHNGRKFLTVKRDKHRYVDDTPKAHQYFAYEFSDFGILPDFGKDPRFVRDIYTVDSSENQKSENGTEESEIVMNLF